MAKRKPPVVNYREKAEQLERILATAPPPLVITIAISPANGNIRIVPQSFTEQELPLIQQALEVAQRQVTRALLAAAEQRGARQATSPPAPLQNQEAILERGEEGRGGTEEEGIAEPPGGTEEAAG